MDEIDLLKEKYKILQSDYQSIEKNIIEFYTEYIDSVNEPQAIILGGQPGSGKSELEKVALKALQRNAVICNVDNLKDWHPKAHEIKERYPEKFSDIVGATAHQWNLALRNECINKRYNFILETTLNNSENINRIIEKLKDSNYKVDIYLLSVPKEISRISIYERYESNLEMGQGQRLVSAVNHDERFDQIPQALLGVEKRKLYDFIHLFGRRVTNLNLDDRLGIYLISKTSRSVYNDFIAERTQNLIDKAKDLVNQKIEKVINLMELRNASKEDIQKFKEEFSNEIEFPQSKINKM